MRCRRRKRLRTATPDRLPFPGQPRVGIARALALGPDLLVADEPTAGLDVSVAAGILNLLKDLGEQLNLTLLIITHNLNIIGFIADKVAVMYLGKVVEVGTTDDIFTRPRHPVYGSVDFSHRAARSDAARQPPAHHPARRDPQPAQPAAGLPVPSPLPLCRNPVRP